MRLDESLAPGEFRELTEEELGALRPPDGRRRKAETGVCRKINKFF
ncbi:MAG: hypothetical protein ACLR4Z_14450 [Butyricicoccaceae bacterium]